MNLNYIPTEPMPAEIQNITGGNREHGDKNGNSFPENFKLGEHQPNQRFDRLSRDLNQGFHG